LTRAGSLDELTVVVELSAGSPDGPECCRLLSDRIKKFVGISAKIELAPAGSIPQSQGKAKHVFDLRGPA
jgi:phenylacetate-CoA ligase